MRLRGNTLCPQLASATEEQTRTALLRAFRSFPKGTSVGPNPEVLRWRILVHRTLILLPEPPANDIANKFIEFVDQHGQAAVKDGASADAPDVRRLLSAVWRLVAEGVFYLRFLTNSGTGLTAISYVGLTERGVRVADNPNEHPLAGDLAGRLRARCPTLPDPVIARFEDAQVCLGANLYRAAVVMVGLAYEETVEHLANHLVASGHAKAKPKSWKLGDRTDWLRKRVEQLPKSETKRRALN